MIGNDLKKLNRRELVDLIYQMKKNEQHLQGEIAALQEELQNKRIHLSKAGSVAEAAVSITNVLSAAQTTADLYLHEISCMKQETENICAKMIEEASQRVTNILMEGEKQFAKLSARYQSEYKKLQLLQKEIQVLDEKCKRSSNED